MFSRTDPRKSEADDSLEEEAEEEEEEEEEEAADKNSIILFINFYISRKKFQLNLKKN